MKLRIFTEPQQGATYDDLLAVARATEDLGFDAFFSSDHYLHMGDHTDGRPGPTDAWTTLAGLARETSRIRLGTLVSSVTYRWPGILAVQAAGVDQMSGGRVEIGLGTGWYRREHEAYGIPFPARRFGMLEEQLEILTGIWNTPSGGRFNFDGEHYSLVDCPGLATPVQATLPVIVGGGGPSRTPALAARFAGEFNLPFPDRADISAKFRNVREACQAIERDPDTLTYSTSMIAVVGRTEAEFASRAEAIGRDPAELRRAGIAGTVDEAAESLQALAADGVERVYLQIMDLQDLDHLELIARRVMPQV
ncbi:LLM class F420-dependent oxidoreductase [Spelaeicoccus albus]|uniref:F420-dependent oxidoreductase-like protein n=1 Tax=Spelaeicoccus albus TaxID=1280376 RepID=A0A7Z0D2V9_9MICO|nr:LLM class F420-dependent oxidoreductase [Spelaeicoccus albus]NYI67884.1 F420-dependent oxidoreductase-like protein [Spelaeicoccus albus]